ncbi:Mediator of RNA polymerase II transcription subunit 24 [Armadillidium vulgare]|nr:Mediator of RNA polymerase II transcription subunit 24 [Armadillidium vulgare]
MVLEPTGIRSLLIRAWRERWTDVQWGIHIKTVLPRYISGDIYQLSDCLLQQALLGSLPNNLILSYLHHSLASQIVSYGGVIESISKYDGVNKPYCIQALLNLMHSMMKNVHCKGKPEDCLKLASALVDGVKWLIQVMIITIEKLVELQTAPEHSANLNLSRNVLQDILSRPFLMCLFNIGCKEDSVVWNECLQRISQLEININGATAGIIENKEALLSDISEIKQVKPMSSIREKPKYDPNKALFGHSVSALVFLEGLTLSELYFEVLRTCFIGLGSPEYKKYQELKWVGYTYIKLSNIIHSIHTSLHGENAGFSKELLTAIQKLSSMTTLLDVADHRVRCNCLEYFFKELIPKGTPANQTNQTPSLDLLSERDAQTILATRMQESNVLKTIKSNESQGSPLSSPDLILRAQPTVLGILKTLTNKNMDSVMPVLSLLISGKSRDLLLIAATSRGDLHIYAQKFVKLNELSMEPTAEAPKLPSTRALTFDISFLLLCHIAQIYGIDVVVSESCDTFVEKWIQNNIPELGKIKTVINPSEVIDVGLIEEFLRQINCMDSETKYIKSNFADLCRFSALAMREMISAAHLGQVGKQMIFELLDKLCCYLCSLPICVTAWLCSYIQQVDGEEAALAMEFIQHLQTKIHVRENVTSSLETFKDRSNLMSEIIGNMADTMKKPNILNIPLSNVSSTNPVPLTDILNDVWNDLRGNNGILTHRVFSLSQDLLRLGGVKWFVTNFVNAALDNVFEDELLRSVDVIYGLFHLDIVNCTLNHVIYTLPSYICGPFSADLMCETRAFSLGRLTAMLLIECWVSLQPQNVPASEVTKTVVVSPVTHLIVFILKELISFPHASTILSLIPPPLLSNLLPLLSPPLTFDYAQLLALSAPDCYQDDISPLPLDILIQSNKKEKEVKESAAKLLCVKRNLDLHC